jgi:putative acyl-CoA dehydrogenase
MMGLDVMRAIAHAPDAIDALLQEIKLAAGTDRHFDIYVKKLESELVRYFGDFEPHARRLMSIMAQAAQGSLLIRQSIPEVSDAFCASRLGGEWAHEFGTLKQTGSSLRNIVDRAVIDI